MMISGGKGGMFIYVLLMLFLAYKKNEVRLMFISFCTFILALVLLSYTNICNTSVYIEQNKSGSVIYKKHTDGFYYPKYIYSTKQDKKEYKK